MEQEQEEQEEQEQEEQEELEDDRPPLNWNLIFFRWAILLLFCICFVSEKLLWYTQNFTQQNFF